MTSKRTYAKPDLPRLFLPVPLSLQQATADPAFQETLKHSQAGLTVSCGVTAPVPGPWCTHSFVCALRESLFPLVCASSVIKSHCPSKSDSLGTPSPFVGSDDQVGKSDVGPRTFATVQEFTLIQILSLSHSHPFSVVGSSPGLSWAWLSSLFIKNGHVSSSPCNRQDRLAYTCVE